MLTFFMLANDEWVLVVLFVDSVFAVLAILDLLTLPGRKAFSIEREASRVAP